MAARGSCVVDTGRTADTLKDMETEQDSQQATRPPRRVTAADLAPSTCGMPIIPYFIENARAKEITLHDCPERSGTYQIIQQEKFRKANPCHQTCKYPNQGEVCRFMYTQTDGLQFSVNEHRLTVNASPCAMPDVTHLLKNQEEVEIFMACRDTDGCFSHEKFLELCNRKQLDEFSRLLLHRNLHQAINAHIMALRSQRDLGQTKIVYVCSFTEEANKVLVRSRESERNVVEPVQKTDTTPNGASEDTDPSSAGNDKEKFPPPAATPKKTTTKPGDRKRVRKALDVFTPKVKKHSPTTHAQVCTYSDALEIVNSPASHTKPPGPPTAQPTTETTVPVMDKVSNANEGLVFNGDIEGCWQGIFERASVDPKQLSKYSLEIRSLQWGWVHCVTDAPTSLINRRVDSSTEASCRAVAQQGKGLRDQMGLKEVSVPLPGGGKGVVPINNTIKIKRREDGLSARAKKIAEDLRNNPARIRGFLAHGHINRKWTAAVCRYLRAGKGIMPESSELFNDVEASKAIGRKKLASNLNTATKALVEAWATKDVGPIMEKKDSKEHAGILDDDVVDEVNSELHAGAVYASARAAGILSAVHNARVCIHCLLANTSAPLHTDEGKYANLSKEELRTLNLERLLKSDAQGYLEACAAIHNREQHALNGNIHFTAPSGSSRFDVAFLAREKANKIKLAMDTERPTDTALLNVCESNLSKANFYTDNSKHSVIPSAQGTLHQYSYDPAVWDGILAMARDNSILDSSLLDDGSEIESWKRLVILGARGQCTGPEEYFSITEGNLFSAANDQPSLEIPMYLRPRYTSVHTLSTHRADQIGLTTAATERIASSSAFASGGIGINDQRGYNIMNYVSGANLLLGSALKMATTDNLDWREIGLKAALLEACREPTVTWPTGQDWAIPRRAKPDVKYFPTVDRDIRAIVVSVNYIDACLRENNDLKVLVDGAVDNWSLSDAHLKVVSLGEDTSNTELTRCLRTILALPFPVVNVIEEYQLKYLGEKNNSYNRKCFHRNAGLVAMGDKVNRIVFVVPDKAQTHVKLSGVFREVTCPTRFNNADTIATAWYADETILRMLHTLMGCGRNLKVLCNEYLSKYSESPLDWNEVQAMCAALTTRFPRQPHVHMAYHREEDLTAEHLYSYGVPKKIMNAYGLRGYVPQDETDARYYGHGEAITCFSQLLIDGLKLCENTCHLSIGKWSNYAEILFSTCVAQFTPGTSMGDNNIRIGLKSTGIDSLNKMSLIRRSVEEWASATGMAEYVLNPRLYPRSSGNIEAYITGGGNDPKIVTLRVWASTCIGGASVSWYWSPNYERSAPLAPNHRRLGSALYQTDYTLSFKSLDLPPRNYVSNNTIGSRGYGWAHQRGMDPTDDYEIEKLVSRLDFHRVNEWGYLQWPDGDVKREGSYRISSTTVANLASAAGWRGFNDSYDGNWGWGVDYMKTDLQSECIATLALRPTTVSRALASVFVPGLWQSIGIGLDTSVETTSSIIDRMRGFSLAAQPPDNSFLTQLEQVLALHLPTRSDGVTSNTSTNALLQQAVQAERAAISSHHGVMPSPLPSSNPEVTPKMSTSQDSGPQSQLEQVRINSAVPPTTKLGTDGLGGIALDQTVRADVN
nr:hypothetical protein 1 [Totiviridae sp.]